MNEARVYADGFERSFAEVNIADMVRTTRDI